MSKFVVQLHTPYFYGKQPHNHTSISQMIIFSQYLWLRFEYANCRVSYISNIPSPGKQKLQLLTGSFSPSTVKFDRLQRTVVAADNIEAEFAARHAQLDHEYWVTTETVACLRAETHWEGREHDRYVENYKRKFAEQEFNEMRKRYNAQLGEMCKCIVMVRKEGVNVNRNALDSVVGTLDLNVRYFSHGLKFPGGLVKPPNFCVMDEKSSARYGYITNLCVAKSFRRQGVASSMLHFALASSKAQGTDKVFVHVYKSNIYAQDLYQKLGFQVVEASPTSQFSEDQTYLLCLEC